MNNSEYPVAFVLWRDACQEAAEDTNTPLRASPLVDLMEVGWLIAEDSESISLAMEQDVESGLAGRWRLHIPKNGIIEMRVLDFARFPKRKRKV